MRRERSTSLTWTMRPRVHVASRGFVWLDRETRVARFPSRRSPRNVSAISRNWRCQQTECTLAIVFESSPGPTLVSSDDGGAMWNEPRVVVQGEGRHFWPEVMPKALGRSKKSNDAAQYYEHEQTGLAPPSSRKSGAAPKRSPSILNQVRSFLAPSGADYANGFAMVCSTQLQAASCAYSRS